MHDKYGSHYFAIILSLALSLCLSKCHTQTANRRCLRGVGDTICEWMREGRTGRPEEERCRCVRCDQHSKKRSGLSMHKLSCSTKVVHGFSQQFLINGNLHVHVWYPLILHVEWLQRFNHMYIIYMGTCTKGQPHTCTCNIASSRLVRW